MARTFTYLLLCLSYCLSGCLLSGAKDIDKRGKIPVDAARWYQLNNTARGLTDLFNGKETDEVNVGWGLLLKNYEAYYPLLGNEVMTIDSIKMFDWKGTTADKPMKIYAILQDWSRVQIAEFTGDRYNEWVGPDPRKPDKYSLDKPASNIRGLVINSWGNFPGEIEFYGPYKPATNISTPPVHAAPLKNFFGVNAFEWDFEDPNAPTQLDNSRLAVVKNFTGVRHYMDWEKLEGQPGQYAFSPTYNGSWNYDVIYQWCHDNNIDVLACLKTIPTWLQATYPQNERDNECAPLRCGRDLADPKSYVEQAKVGFQYAARYGSNKNIDNKLLTVRGDNMVRVGLGLIKYVECDNERDKWWKGRKAYQTGREYAANLSAFYDGDKKTMGAGVGVKNADPEMKVVMGGLASTTTDYLRGMIDWCREHRGYKPDGTIDCPWDVINYHFYSNDASTDPEKGQKTGIAPELSKADSFAKEYVKVAGIYAGNMPVWVTEAGYDLNPGSPQKAPAESGKSAQEVQADWILRTSLLYARSGVQKVFYYELYDDNASSGDRYATSGLADKNNKVLRPAGDYLRQVNKLFGNYTYKETISRAPMVDRYTEGQGDMYVLVAPGKPGRYILDIGSAAGAVIYKPKAGSQDMLQNTVKAQGGKVEVTVGETPVFVKTVKNG